MSIAETTDPSLFVVWLVTLTLIVAAVIDGLKLKVPNWLTYPFIFTGWAYSFYLAGWTGLGYSVLGTVAGMAMLLPAYAIGGMGAGDVKLLAGVGAWMHVGTTAWAFVWTVVIGAVLAVAMVLYRQSFQKHANQFWFILTEIITVRDPEKLAQIAAERKPSMMLLPYGIPIAIGSIGYFCWQGWLV